MAIHMVTILKAVILKSSWRSASYRVAPEQTTTESPAKSRHSVRERRCETARELIFSMIKRGDLLCPSSRDLALDQHTSGESNESELCTALTPHAGLQPAATLRLSSLQWKLDELSLVSHLSKRHQAPSMW